MPRDGNGAFFYSTAAVVDGTTIVAATENSKNADVLTDLNAARPISSGGTGATSAAGARSNLGVVAAAGGTFSGAVTFSDAATFSGATVVPNASADTHALNRQTGDARYVTATTGRTEAFESEQTLIESETSDTDMDFTTLSATAREHIFEVFAFAPQSVGVFEMTVYTDSTARTCAFTLDILEGDGTITSTHETGDTVVIMATNVSNSGPGAWAPSGKLFGRIRFIQMQNPATSGGTQDNYHIAIEWDLSWSETAGNNGPFKRALGRGYVSAGVGGFPLDRVVFSPGGTDIDCGNIRHYEVEPSE